MVKWLFYYKVVEWNLSKEMEEMGIITAAQSSERCKKRKNENDYEQYAQSGCWETRL